MAALERANQAIGSTYTPNATVVKQGIGAILADYIKDYLLGLVVVLLGIVFLRL